MKFDLIFKFCEICWVQLRDFYLFFFRHAIIVNGYVDDHTWRGIRHRNWGDDLNYYFLKELTGRPIVFYHNFKLAKLLHFKNYMCIGTLLDAVNYSNANTIVWGSGCSGLNRRFVAPEQIKAVRGAKTKDYCESFGVKCPDVYGDPALLLPLIYPMNNKIILRQNKKKRIGVIPNIYDLNHFIIYKLHKESISDVVVINMSHYNHWTDIIEEIRSCDIILSSSLHGLIVSDAYRVPNVWISLSGNAIVGHYKFLDYLDSVGRLVDAPIKVDNVEILYTLKGECASSKKILELQKKLIKSCPFNIKNKWL